MACWRYLTGSSYNEAAGAELFSAFHFSFSPDKPVTRQEMAVFMQSYAKAMGYVLPKTREAVTFADNAGIGCWAAEAVRAMQTAGIINGKDGNRFDPTGTATRAEVSAVLRRYVELEQLNGKSRYDMIYAGQTLRVPRI